MFVKHPNIPCAHPAVWREGSRSQLRRVVIASDRRRCTHRDFARRPGWNIIARLVKQPDVNIERWLTAGIQQIATMVLWPQDRQTLRDFGLAVVLPEPMLSPQC